MALGLTGTTAKPASSRVSTRRPSGRSIATAIRSTVARRLSRRTRVVNPAALCSMLNAATRRPVWSSTQTAWLAAAQSIPT